MHTPPYSGFTGSRVYSIDFGWGWMGYDSEDPDQVLRFHFYECETLVVREGSTDRREICVLPDQPTGGMWLMFYMDPRYFIVLIGSEEEPMPRSVQQMYGWANERCEGRT